MDDLEVEVCGDNGAYYKVCIILSMVLMTINTVSDLRSFGILDIQTLFVKLPSLLFKQIPFISAHALRLGRHVF